MSSTSHQKRTSESVLFRFLLVLALWTGPVPWGHQHHLNSADMESHLAKFHSGQSCEEIGWHWHLSTPDGENPASPEQEHEHHQPASPDSARPDVRVAEAITSLQLLLVWDAIPHDVSPMLDAISAGRRAGEVRLLPCSDRTTQQLLCRLTC